MFFLQKENMDLKILVNGQEVFALVYTGADRSFIWKGYVETFRL